MLTLLNALYQIFNFFTGGSFINQMFGVGTGGTFFINWNTPIAILYISSFTAALVLLLFVIGLTFASNIFQTRSSKETGSVVSKLKYVFYFFAGIIGIPFIFITLNMIVNVLASIMGVNNSVRIDNVIIENTNTYLLPIVRKLGVFSDININGFTLIPYLDKLSAQLIIDNKNAIDAGNTALSQELTNLLENVNNIRNSAANLANIQDQILVILKNLEVDKVDIAASEKLNNLIQELNYIQSDFIGLNSSLESLVPRYGGNITAELSQLANGYNGSFADLNSLGQYFSKNGVFNQLMSGSNDFNGLVLIRTYLSGIKDFDLVSEIYRLTVNDPTAVDWQSVPKWVNVDTLVIGIASTLASVVILFLYTFYTIKRLFVIAIYFVISPFILVTGIKDDGYIASAFFKTLLVKFSSLIFITIGMQIVLVVTSGQYGFNNLINQWQANQIVVMTAKVILIIAGLLAGYTTSGAISKLFGDDGSVMESLQDIMIISRGFSIASIPMSAKGRRLASASLAGATKLKSVAPITKTQKLVAAQSRLKNLQGLGIRNVKKDSINTYSNYRRARNEALKGVKTWK